MISAIADILFKLNALFVNRIVVNQRNYKSALGNTIYSNKEYFIDGIITIDNPNFNITVPSGGISIKGYDYDKSQIVCSLDDYTLFDSPVGGSGNVLCTDVSFETSGANSKVYDLTDATGFNAIEYNRVNYNNCTSLGELTNYRQGLESGTGRFGGTPNLILSGTWVGGFRISTSIVRSIDNSMSGALFEEGASFVMNGRFVTDINADLGTSAALLDFAPSNFNGSNRLQLNGTEISRGGVFDPSDSTITPNIAHSDIESYWSNNVGVYNTIIEGTLNVSSEATTSIGSSNTYYDLDGTWTDSDTQHMDSPSNGVLRYLNSVTREFNIQGQIVIEGNANDVIDIKIVIYRDATATDEDARNIERKINNISGSRDVAYFVIFDTFVLNENDTVRLQVENTTAARDMTAELDSFWTLQAK